MINGILSVRIHVNAIRSQGERQAMQINGPAHVHGPQQINSPHKINAPQPAQSTGGIDTSDQLDISDTARALSAARDVPDIRQDRVTEIRAQIAAGTYETAEKLDSALEQLLDEIG